MPVKNLFYWSLDLVNGDYFKYYNFDSALAACQA